ncbi:hypothetical protein Cgig2_032410 [Carnegiea gigantea]|uniref:BED-type domain-containing protein n=1 Tax=Carnegiea gigantea TaxID=171969 RepID=A0A9Q1KVR1_9CARY|nr:hypothetical protein Cgig2_032410 [Carnegiea gigantea]
MAPQHGSRGRGRRAYGFDTSAFPSPSPSPLVRNSNARAPTHPSGSSIPCTPLTVELDDDSPSTKRRRWTSSVWKHYNIKEGKHFLDDKDRPYCKYCNGGPIDADSSNGTSHFRHHTDVGQMMMAEDIMPNLCTVGLTSSRVSTNADLVRWVPFYFSGHRTLPFVESPPTVGNRPPLSATGWSPASSVPVGATPTESSVAGDFSGDRKFAGKFFRLCFPPDLAV